MAIRTPDQRLRVFVSSTLGELAAERRAVSRAIAALRLTPVLFELGARPHPRRPVYRAYLAQGWRDEDLTGYDRLQLLLTVALADNFLGQVRLSQAGYDAAARLFSDGLAVARRAQDGIPVLVSL